jgi:D-glycero-D-manno-heptose 1,7-bisphosphate phosphatase
MKNKAIFLDRDGVVNRIIYENNVQRSPRSMDEFEYEQGILEFIQNIKKLDFEIAIITNQPEVKRGLVSRDTVEQFHKKIRSELGIDHFFVCWHDSTDNCNCRKPKPGLFFDAKEKLQVNLEDSFMIGDREKDIISAKSAGCNGILYTKNESDFALHQFASYRSFPEILLAIQKDKRISKVQE